MKLCVKISGWMGGAFQDCLVITTVSFLHMLHHTHNRFITHTNNNKRKKKINPPTHPWTSTSRKKKKKTTHDKQKRRSLFCLLPLQSASLD